MLESENAMAVAKVIDIIGSTSGYNDKLLLLKKNEHVTGLKKILHFIYNPYVKSGIGPEKLQKALFGMSALSQPHTEVTIDSVIDWLVRHQTGSDRDIAYVSYFLFDMQKHGESTFNLAKAIVSQNLQIGVTKTSLNTVFGKDFIPVVAPMLGTEYSKVSKIKWPCIVTEKLDGARRILLKQGGDVRMYTRSGHEDAGLVDIETEATAFLPDNHMYDGELLAIGQFSDSIALRQATNAIANSNGIRHGLTFNVFDMMPIDQFFAGKSVDNALSRKMLLAATLDDDEGLCLLATDSSMAVALSNAYYIGESLTFIKPVPILGVANNMDEVTPIVAPIWQRHFEGVMLNTISGFYEIKRSKELIKIKDRKEITLKIIDVLEGDGKFDEMLGSLIVCYNGYRVGVGSGFSEAQRREIWNNWERYIGREIEIEYFGESRNQDGGLSLNCPIFKRFKGDV